MLAVVLAAHAIGQNHGNAAADTSVAERLSVTAFEIVSIDGFEPPPDGGPVVVQLGATIGAVVVAPMPDVGPDGRSLRPVVRAVPALPADATAGVARPIVYRGTIRDDAGSRVVLCASVLGLHGRVARANGDVLWIQPLRSIDRDAAPALHVVYRQSDIVVPPGLCPVEAPADAAPPPEGGVAGTGGLSSVAQIAFDADYEYYLKNDASVAETEADITAVMSAVNEVYERDCGITHAITEIVVRTVEPDPYTSTNHNARLSQMKTEWNTNQSGVPRDVAHLMTGVNLDGSVIGAAYVGTVCETPQAYGLTQNQYTTNFGLRTALTAHELGHCWNATHCNQVDPPQTPCNIMCSTNGGCQGIGLPNFGPYSIGKITSFAAGLDCLQPGTTWVDFAYSGTEQGTFDHPFNTLAEALAALPPGGHITIKAGATSATITTSTPTSIEAYGGSVT
ncbi:MAG: hypothetical protein KDA22_12880, partial [Phycisphaerales bacterium]|nr:hypothetical protein [Phycisphaerales bacterium]